jgi:hypothetical protein
MIQPRSHQPARQFRGLVESNAQLAINFWCGRRDSNPDGITAKGF